ncbi:hypothetical protein LI328DRAFT_84147 [Trichoderma asperelloides]|nr:hypothetical protein LI328DRAFT_84147 [Trichoderma asperelloides]
MKQRHLIFHGLKPLLTVVTLFSSASLFGLSLRLLGHTANTLLPRHEPFIPLYSPGSICKWHSTVGLNGRSCNLHLPPHDQPRPVNPSCPPICHISHTVAHLVPGS